MKRHHFVLALGLVTAAVTAQSTAILPASAEGIAGNASNAFPWGTSASTFPGMRIQCIYDSTHFTNQPVGVTTPILITNVKWRANDVSFNTNWTGGTYTAATLALATAAVDHAAATTAFATNVGPDYTVVHNGPVTVLPGPGAGVGQVPPYIVSIPVVPPFLYDPSQGDLVVDVDFLTGAWGGGTFVALDVHSTNLLARRVFASSMYPVANGVDSSVPVIEVAFTASGAGTLATNTTLGDGCIRKADASTYELFATSAAFDLANTSISLVRSSEGYVAVPGTAAYVPPSATAQVLTLANNAQVSVALSQPMPVGRTSTTSSLFVCSNGFISPATGNGTGGTPSATTFLDGSQMFWALCWHDFDPSLAGSGSIKFEQVGNVAYVTWDGVWDAAGTSAANASTMQAQFDVTTGNVNYVYGTTSALGNARLVGVSDGGSSVNPGSMDISAALPATYTAAVFRLDPLTLTRGSRPVLGTTWNLNVSRIPAAGVLGIDILGISDPAVLDLAFLGAPGCGARASLDVLAAWLPAGSTHSYSLAIPNTPALINFHVFTQSAVFQPGVNTLFGGLITSNGIDGMVGDA